MANNDIDFWTGGYAQVGGPENVSNVNPYTQDIIRYLMGDAGTGGGGLLERLLGIATGGMGGLEGRIGASFNTNLNPGDLNAYNAVNLPNAPTPTNPQAAFNAFTSYAPELQNLVQGATSDFAQEQLGLADMVSERAVQDVLAQYSGQGAYYSGPSMQAAVEAGARPRQEAVANITGLQSNLAGVLMNQGLAQMPRAYQAAAGEETARYGIGTNAALGLGSQGLQAREQNLDYLGLAQGAQEGNRDALLRLLGIESGTAGALAGTALGGALDFGQQEFYEPDYEHQPGALDYLLGLVGAAAPIAGAAMGAGM